jgi:hypothetical protein
MTEMKPSSPCLVVCVVLATAGCLDDRNEARDRQRLESMRVSIEDMVGEATCTDSADCMFIGFGSKPCGGFWSYLIYSASTVDTLMLHERVAEYNVFEDRLNELYGWMSDCSVPPVPAVTCRDGRCVDLRSPEGERARGSTRARVSRTIRAVCLTPALARSSSAAARRQARLPALSEALEHGPVKERTALIIGCSGIGALAIIAIAVIAAWFMHVTKDPEGVWLNAEAPLDVRVGDTFELVIKVTNRLQDRDIALGDLDISDEYLRGFRIVSVTPDPRSTTIDDLNDCTTTRFGTDVGPGATAEFRFELRAERAGSYRGEVDQYVGMQFVTSVVETAVHR